MVALGIILVSPFAPIIGLVCIPIFGVKALLHWLNFKPLYKKTLSHGTREKYGRIPGQDYTRWDGKQDTTIQINPWLDQRNRRISAYLHGNKENEFRYLEEFIESAFSTYQDLEWLELELISRREQEFLNNDLKRLRASAIALIPLFGAIWVILAETRVGGVIKIPYPACAWGHSFHETHWYWHEALYFHIQNLKKISRHFQN